MVAKSEDLETSYPEKIKKTQHYHQQTIVIIIIIIIIFFFHSQLITCKLSLSELKARSQGAAICENPRPEA